MSEGEQSASHQDQAEVAQVDGDRGQNGNAAGPAPESGTVDANKGLGATLKGMLGKLRGGGDHAGHTEVAAAPRNLPDNDTLNAEAGLTLPTNNEPERTPEAVSVEQRAAELQEEHDTAEARLQLQREQGATPDALSQNRADAALITMSSRRSGRAVAAVTALAVGLAPAALAATNGSEHSGAAVAHAGSKETTLVIDKKLEAVYQHDFAEDPQPGELDPEAVQGIQDFAAQVGEAQRAGITVDSITINAQSSATNREGDQARDLAGVDRVLPDDKNIPLAEARRDDPGTNTTLTEALHAVAEANGQELPPVTKGYARKDVFGPDRVAQIQQLAKDGHYPTAWWLATAYNEPPAVVRAMNPHVPAELTPELRAQVDKLLDDERYVELIATAHVQANTPPEVVKIGGKEIRKDFAVPAWSLVDLPPGTGNNPLSPKEMKQQHYTAVGHHHIQPREVSMGNNQNEQKAGKPRGKVSRTHGGDRG